MSSLVDQSVYFALSYRGVNEERNSSNDKIMNDGVCCFLVFHIHTSCLDACGISSGINSIPDVN